MSDILKKVVLKKTLSTLIFQQLIQYKNPVSLVLPLESLIKTYEYTRNINLN